MPMMSHEGCYEADSSFRGSIFLMINGTDNQLTNLTVSSPKIHRSKL